VGEGWRKEGGRLPRVDFIITECRLFYASSATFPLLPLLLPSLLLLLVFTPRAFLPRRVAQSADIHVLVLLSPAAEPYTLLRGSPLLFRRYSALRGSLDLTSFDTERFTAQRIARVRGMSANRYQSLISAERQKNIRPRRPLAYSKKIASAPRCPMRDRESTEGHNKNIRVEGNDSGGGETENWRGRERERERKRERRRQESEGERAIPLAQRLMDSGANLTVEGSGHVGLFFWWRWPDPPPQTTAKSR